MKKRLYAVEARWYVMAEDEEEAQYMAPANSETSVFAIAATSVDSDWWDAIPFGGDNDRTCGQILADQRKDDPR